MSNLSLQWDRTSPSNGPHQVFIDTSDLIIERWNDVAGTTPIMHADTDGTNIRITSDLFSIQTRLRLQWPYILGKARQTQDEYPNAVQSLIDLLGDLPIEDEIWREIIEEPYG